MATLGNIRVAFTADLVDFEAGVGKISDLLDGLTDSVKEFSEKVDGSANTLRVSTAVDTKAVDSAADQISKTSAAVEVKADTTEAEKSISRFEVFLDTLSKAASRPEKLMASLGKGIAGLASETRKLGDRSGADALNEFAEESASAVSIIGETTAAAGSVSASVSSASSAIAAWTTEYTTLFNAIDKTIAVIANSETAVAAFSAAIASGTTLLGGSGQLMAALGGSALAAANAVGSLAGAVVGAVASLGTYAAITGIVNAATAGMSEESRAYIKEQSQLFAVTASTSAGLLASSSTFQLVSSQIQKTGLASETLAAVLGKVGAQAASAASMLAPVASTLSTLASAVGLVSAASEKNMSGAGFAGMVANVVATSAATGAAIGGIKSLALGTGVLSGAATGAASAVSALAATWPVTAGLAITAAVATGKFRHELEELSVQAQQVDQMQERFGGARDGIEQLRLAATNTGVGFSQLARGQQTFYSSLSKIKVGQLNVENVREAKLAFDSLGISLEDIKGKDPSEVFRLVAEEIGKVEDPAKRTQIAFDLFGKQGAAILPALKEFGELEADFKRLGGSLAEIDFQRFLALENSFDRVKQAASVLGTVLVVPFSEMQKAFNNFSADVKGGLASALGPIATLLADITKPLSVIIEVAGRVINVFLQIFGVITTLVAGFMKFAGIADLFDGIQAGIMSAIAPVEKLIGFLQSAADAITTRFGAVSAIFNAIGQAIGFVVGGVIQLATYIAIGAAAWGLYSVAVATATGFSLASIPVFISMWAAALGPFAPIIAGFIAIGAGVALITAGVSKLVGWFYDLGKSAGLWGGEVEKINASAASVDEVASAAEIAASASNGLATGLKAVVAAVPGGGVLAEAVFGGFEEKAAGEIAASLEQTREELGGLTIEAARFGDAGADAASAANTAFNELQQKLAEGQIDLPTFEEESKKIQDNLRKNLDILKDDSPEVTLKKNLELYRELDQAAKTAAKSVRDIGSGVQIGDKFFPRSDEIKRRAQQFKDEYVAALEEIKKKQQSGDFGREIKAKKQQNEQAFKSGQISKEQFEAVRLELDTTTSQEQAKIAAEEVQREFDRKKVKLEADLSFADEIRKSLETAFLSPVEKFDKELKKIRENPELTDSEKSQAETSLRKSARESLVGKDAQTQLTERKRDLTQAKEAGLITDGRAQAELQKAMDDFRQAVGAPSTPLTEFASSINNITSQFGFAGQSVDEVREKLKGNADQLAIFESALKDATRKRDEALGAGSDAGGRIAEKRSQIQSAYGGGKDNARLAIASNRADMEQRRAAGLDATASQKLKAGADSIADAFGVTGKSMAEIQASLSPEKFAEFQEAMKKNSDVAKAAVGVQQSGASKLKEAQEKLKQAVADGVVSQEEAAAATRRFRDDFMSSIGVTKTPFEEFSGSIDNIAEQFDMAGQPLDQVREKLKGNAEDLALFDRAVKQARDNLLASLGIEKSPQQVFEETMKKIEEAANATDPNKRISKEEADQARKIATRKRDEALGAGNAAQNFGDEIRERKKKIEEAYGVNGEKDKERYNLAMRELGKAMPGAESESPVQKFKDEMSKLDNLKGTISEEDYAQRKKVLQAQLQEDMKPALDRLAPDRRSVESSDARSKGGVDTFFRILRGNDNPSLKAQLEIARNTKLLAEAANEPEAAPVLANIQGR